MKVLQGGCEYGSDVLLTRIESIVFIISKFIILSLLTPQSKQSGQCSEHNRNLLNLLVQSCICE